MEQMKIIELIRLVFGPVGVIQARKVRVQSEKPTFASLPRMSFKGVGAGQNSGAFGRPDRWE
jgi:hypothetical protein